MGLTSGFFLWLMLAAATGSIAGITWLWPRLARQRPGQIAARLALITLSQLLVVTALLTGLNDSLQFFNSWSELFGPGAATQAWTSSAVAARAAAHPIVITGTSLGTDYALGTGAGPGGLSPSSGGASSAATPSAGGQPGGTPSGGQQQPRPAAAARSGEVLQVTIRGPYTGISSLGDYVYLPPQYFQPGYARARFPVVVTFTGYPNETINLIRLLRLPEIAAKLTAAGRIEPAIYVLINPSVALPRDTECTNVPAGPQVATFFGRDVPYAVARTFRAQPGPAGWALVGYSTGGYCAAKLAMLYPDQFTAAVSMSGYYIALRDQTTGNLYGGSSGYRDENDLIWRLRHLPAPPVSMLVASSSGEKNLPGTLTFLHLIHAPMRGYSLILHQGGHNYYTWRRELPQSLEWLSARLTPPS